MAQEDTAVAKPVNRRTFTVDEYYRMADAGILHEDDRVELIEGEIVEMAAIGSLHAACVSKMNRLLVGRLPENLLVRVQDPLRLSDLTEPQPDLVVILFREDYYAQAHPLPPETLLVVEVADSSLAYDKQVKIPLYARAGIPEVWIVDLTAGEVLVHRRPGAHGYGQVDVHSTGEGFVSDLHPHEPFNVDDMLP